MVWRKGYTGATVTRWVSWADEVNRVEDIARVRSLDWMRQAG